MTAIEVLGELRNRGIRVEPRPTGNLYLAPKNRLTRELVERVRAHKPAILAHLRAMQDQAENDRRADADAKQDRRAADEALALLNRLKCYSLPAGRMPAARVVAERLRPLLTTPALDSRQALGALQAVEAELTALGAAPDRELAEAVAMVERTFPGALLAEVRKLQ
jgi:hypothetical protein